MSTRKRQPAKQISSVGLCEGGLVFSGAIGGPSTYRGTSYQADYAVYRALELIRQALCTPTAPLRIGMEPRGAVAGDPTEWDVFAGPPMIFSEVKIMPTRRDIVEWLKRVCQAAAAAPEPRYQLIYGSGGGPLLRRLSTLIENAAAAGTAEHFSRLVENGRANSDVDEILTTLGDDAFTLIQRVELVQLPPTVLAGDIELRAGLLAGETEGRNLVNLLFRKFSTGAPTRQTFSVRELIHEIREQEIPLQTPPIREAKGVSAKTAAALVIFQSCKTGIPLAVVASAVGAAESDLARDLAPMVNNGIVITDDLWSIVILPTLLNPSDAPTVLAAALESLLDFIEHDPNSKAGRIQIYNAVELAKHCHDTRPSLVAQVFRRLDKRLKDLGDKHLVLEAAELSISAARQVPQRSKAVVEAEAHALICGRSWVFQRIGRLTEARAAAETSLRIGEDIQWERNTAYCKKCIGRLYRLEAEAEVGTKRQQLLAESVTWLTVAIERFGAAAEFGPNHSEVGDCHSLVGRTYLTMGRIPDAEVAIRLAHELIPQGDSKDYSDLLILGGDWEASLQNWRAACGRYDDALELLTDEGAEKSEMRARAHAGRARARTELGDKTLAVTDYREASEIYRGLGEDERAAAVRWEVMLLLGQIPTDLTPLLANERATVRVATIDLHAQRLEALSKPALARRSSAPGRPYWLQLIGQAKQRVAAEEREW